MFDMFRGGAPDPVTLMAVDYETRREELDEIVDFIKKHYTCGKIDIEDICAECGTYHVTPEEIKYIENKINKR